MSFDSSLSSFHNSSVFVFSFTCFEFSVGSYIFTALLAFYVISLFPLCIFILCLGLHRATSNITANNLDIFTYNMVAMELIGVMGSYFFCFGSFNGNSRMMESIYLFIIVMPGQMLFHSLTSVDRYLAVIHPVAYRGLRTAHMIRIRNLIIGSTWAVSFTWMVLAAEYSLSILSVPTTVLLLLSVFVNSFCSLSILCALICPGPGEGGGSRDRVDKSKKRALQTIMAITAVLLLNLGGYLLCILVEATGALGSNDRCVALLLRLSSTVLSSYVMPLLFLHRVGELPCFKRNTESSPVSV